MASEVSLHLEQDGQAISLRTPRGRVVAWARVLRARRTAAGTMTYVLDRQVASPRYCLLGGTIEGAFAAVITCHAT